MKSCLAPLLALVLALPSATVRAAEPKPLVVFAAASLTNALQDVGNLWTAAGHGPVRFSFAASSTLAQQIEHGAPANVFISADEKWMDDLARHHAIAATTREDLLGNSLVLVEPKETLKPIALAQGVSLADVLGPTGRLAVGDPSHVPAGIYAEQALRKLGLWPSLQNRLAPGGTPCGPRCAWWKCTRRRPGSSMRPTLPLRRVWASRACFRRPAMSRYGIRRRWCPTRRLGGLF